MANPDQTLRKLIKKLFTGSGQLMPQGDDGKKKKRSDG